MIVTTEYQDALSMARGSTRVDSLASILFGSYARREHDEWSDIDVLELVTEKPGRTKTGKLSLTSYLPSQLEELVVERSLFAWHLLREGTTISDPSSLLRNILSRHPGIDASLTLSRIVTFSSVLDVSVLQYSEYFRGLNSTLKYLLRSAIYAKSIDSGESSFSIHVACNRVDPSGLLSAMFRRGEDTHLQQDWIRYSLMRVSLNQLIGPLQKNLFGSIEALAVRMAKTQPQLSNLAIHAMTQGTEELDYASTEMPIL